MCTYIEGSNGNHRCDHARDYDPVVRGLSLPEGLELQDEGWIEEISIDRIDELQITDYIGHEKSELTRKVKSGSKIINIKKSI